jgi:hypothetical protein
MSCLCISYTIIDYGRHFIYYIKSVYILILDNRKNGRHLCTICRRIHKVFILLYYIIMSSGYSTGQVRVGVDGIGIATSQEQMRADEQVQNQMLKDEQAQNKMTSRETGGRSKKRSRRTKKRKNTKTKKSRRRRRRTRK